MPDAITVLREDHRRVEKLFKEFEKLLKKKDSDTKAKRTLVEEMIRELSVHAVVEEQVFYPAVRKQVEDAEDVVLEGLEEHHIVKWTLSELSGMSGDEERFDAKVKVLMESVRHHVEEEEGEMFPKTREAIPRKALTELAQTMEQARQQAPEEPQPEAPDEPPANQPKATGAASGSGSGSGSGSNGSGSAVAASKGSGGSGSGSAPAKKGLLGRRRAKPGAKS